MVCLCSIQYHVYEKFWSSIWRVQRLQDVGLMLALRWEQGFRVINGCLVFILCSAMITVINQYTFAF